MSGKILHLNKLFNRDLPLKQFKSKKLHITFAVKVRLVSKAKR